MVCQQKSTKSLEIKRIKRTLYLKQEQRSYICFITYSIYILMEVFW